MRNRTASRRHYSRCYGYGKAFKCPAIIWNGQTLKLFSCVILVQMNNWTLVIMQFANGLTFCQLFPETFFQTKLWLFPRIVFWLPNRIMMHTCYGHSQNSSFANGPFQILAIRFSVPWKRRHRNRCAVNGDTNWQLRCVFLGTKCECLI